MKIVIDIDRELDLTKPTDETIEELEDDLKLGFVSTFPGVGLSDVSVRVTEDA